MNPGQANLSGGGAGMLKSEPVLLSAGDQTIVLNSSMPRPADLALIRLTNVIADNGWTPGEAFQLYQTTVTSPGFVIATTAGAMTLYTEGGALTGVLKTGAHTSFVLTAGSWKLELVAMWFALPSRI